MRQGPRYGCALLWRRGHCLARAEINDHVEMKKDHVWVILCCSKHSTLLSPRWTLAGYSFSRVGLQKQCLTLSDQRTQKQRESHSHSENRWCVVADLEKGLCVRIIVFVLLGAVKVLLSACGLSILDFFLFFYVVVVSKIPLCLTVPAKGETQRISVQFNNEQPKETESVRLWTKRSVFLCAVSTVCFKFSSSDSNISWDNCPSRSFFCNLSAVLNVLHIIPRVVKRVVLQTSGYFISASGLS